MDIENSNDGEVHDFSEADVPSSSGSEATPVGFVDLRLTGGRFETIGLPISGFIEIERLQEIVTTVAKLLWKKSHPERKRVPRNFVSSFDLRLVRVDEGSVVPVLERSDVAPGLWDDEFDRSMDLIDQAFSEIVKNMSLPADFPKEAESALARFGSSLQDDESAIFQSRTANPIHYTSAIRKRFFGEVRHTLVSATGSRVGRISALDVDEQTFRFQGLDGRKVEGVYEDPSHWEDLLEVLKAPSLNCWVRLEGTYRMRPDSSVHSIADVESLEVFDLAYDEPWAPRILELADLPNDWQEDWDAVATQALEYARDLLLVVREHDHPLPGVFPTQEGGVQLEWNTRHQRLAISISPELEVESRLMLAATRERKRIAHPNMNSVKTLFKGIHFDD